MPLSHSEDCITYSARLFSVAINLVVYDRLWSKWKIPMRFCVVRKGLGRKRKTVWNWIDVIIPRKCGVADSHHGDTTIKLLGLGMIAPGL